MRCDMGLKSGTSCRQRGKRREERKIINLIELSVNRVLNKTINTAICEAIILQQQANEEYKAQKRKETAGEPYNYMAFHAYRAGVAAVCQVLQEIFGGLPIDSIRTIEKIVKENENNGYLGYDSRDYVRMFIETFEGKEEKK